MYELTILGPFRSMRPASCSNSLYFARKLPSLVLRSSQIAYCAIANAHTKSNFIAVFIVGYSFATFHAIKIRTMTKA